MVIHQIVGNKILPHQIMSSCQNHLLHRRSHHDLRTLQQDIILDRRRHRQLSQTAVEALLLIIRVQTILFHPHLHLALV